MKRKLVCFCEAEFELDIPTRVDLSEDPKVEEEILQGNFMTAECPECGKLLKPEFPVHIIDPERRIDIFFVPDLDRVSYFRNTLSYKVEDSERVVIGYDELVEKFLLAGYGLNDQVIELIKYYLLNKALQDFESDKEVRIVFRKKERDYLLFHAKGLKEEEIGVLRVPFKMVDKVNLQLEEKKKLKPFTTFLKGPYVSVNMLYSEGPD